MRSEQAHGRLAVHAVHLEEAVLSEAALLALAGELQALAQWLGLVEVALNCRSPVAGRLRPLLMQRP